MIIILRNMDWLFRERREEEKRNEHTVQDKYLCFFFLDCDESIHSICIRNKKYWHTKKTVHLVDILNQLQVFSSFFFLSFFLLLLPLYSPDIYKTISSQSFDSPSLQDPSSIHRHTTSLFSLLSLLHLSAPIPTNAQLCKKSIFQHISKRESVHLYSLLLFLLANNSRSTRGIPAPPIHSCFSHL